MPVVIRKLLPVFKILSQVNFFSGPETSHLFFVHLPNIIVLDRENDESVWVIFQQRLRKSLSKPLSGRILSFNNVSAFLRVVVLDQLRAQNVNHCFSLSISWNYSPSLSEMLGLRKLKLYLFLALMWLIMI